MQILESAEKRFFSFDYIAEINKMLWRIGTGMSKSVDNNANVCDYKLHKTTIWPPPTSCLHSIG